MAKSNTIKIQVIGDTSKFNKSLGESESALQKWNKTAVAVSTAVVGAATVVGRDLINMAADAEQSIGAVDAVFKDSADQIHDWADDAAENAGLSAHAYREMATVVGAQLKNMGVAQDDLGVQTGDLMSKAADLAATFGGPTSDAVSALGALLRGETDPIERYGISIKQADIAAQMAADGTAELEGEQAKLAKTQAIMTLLTEQGSAAWGQFAREGGSAAQQMEVAQAKFDNLRVKLGEELLPAFTTVMDYINDTVLPILDEHSGTLLKVAGAATAVATAVLGINGAFAGMRAAKRAYTQVVEPLSAGMDMLARRSPAAATGVRRFGRALGGLGIGIAAAAIFDLNGYLKEQSDLFGASKKDVENYFGALTTGIQDNPAEMIQAITGDLEKLNAVTSEAPDTEFLGTRIFWTDWSGEAQTAADNADYLRQKKEELQQQMENERIEQNKAAEAAKASAAAEDQLAVAVDGTQQVVHSSQEAFDAYKQSLIDYQTQALSTRDAERGLEAAIDAADEALADNGVTLDITTEKGRANQAALDGIAQAGLEAATALNDGTAEGAKAAGAAMQKAREDFIDTAVEMGMAEEDAKALADQLGLIPENVETEVEVRKSANFNAQINSIMASINRAMTGTVYVEGVRYNRGQMADGGYVGAFADGGRFQRKPNGLLRGPGHGTSDDIFASVSAGEYVTKAAAVDHYGVDFMDDINNMRLKKVRPSGGNSDNIDVYVSISKDEIAGIAEVEIKKNNKTIKRQAVMK